MLGVRDSLPPSNLLTNRRTGREISQPRTNVRVNPRTSQMLGVRVNPPQIRPLTNRQTGREISRLQRSRTIAPKRIVRRRHNQTIVPSRINPITAPRRIVRPRRNQTIVQSRTETNQLRLNERNRRSASNSSSARRLPQRPSQRRLSASKRPRRRSRKRNGRSGKSRSLQVSRESASQGEDVKSNGHPEFSQDAFFCKVLNSSRSVTGSGVTGNGRLVKLDTKCLG